MADDKSGGGSNDTAKNIWLAGLGAYGKAFNEAKDKLDEAAKEPPRLFRELVEKGMRLEDEVKDSISSMRKSHASSVEERINRVRESFNFSMGRGDELTALHDKVDELTAKVDALTAALAKTSRKAPAKKKAAQKKAPAKKKAAARKKAPAKKAAAKKKPAARKKAPARKSR